MSAREKREILRSLFSPGSRKYWELKSDSSRVLFMALVANADDYGRLEGAAVDIETLVPRARAVRWSEKTIEADLKDMDKVGLIERYEADGRTYIEIRGFQDTQNWAGVKAEPSRIPAPFSRSQVAGSDETATTATGRTATGGVDALRPIPKEAKESLLETKEKSFTGASPENQSQCDQASRRTATNCDYAGIYAEARKKYRKYVGKSMGSLGPKGWEWKRLIDENGEETVLRAVEYWAQNLGKAGRNLDWPLAVFLKQAPEWVAEASVVPESESQTVADGPNYPVFKGHDQ